MATIEYSVAGQQIVVTKDEKLVENTIGIYTVGFTFDAASWGDFTQKTAVFVHEDYPDIPPYEVPIDDGEAPIPAAVLKYGNIMIGVYGSTQTQQYPTIWAPAKRVWPGAGPGVEPPEDPVFGMVVRTAPQELTEEQQEIARTNIGAAPEVIPDSTPGNVAIIGSNNNISDSGVSKDNLILAPQLDSSIRTEDNIPYIIRPTGGGIEVGTREIDSIVGGSLNWNQLASIDPDDWSKSNASLTADGNVLTLTATSSSSSTFKLIYVAVPADHVIYITAKGITTPEGRTMYVGCYTGSGSFPSGSARFTVPNSAVSYPVAWLGKSISNRKRATVAIPTTGVSGDTAYIDSMQIFDITEMFGVTMADALYDMEQAESGSGVAVLSKLFNRNMRLAYCPTAQILSAKPEAHIMKDADGNVIGNYPLGGVELRGVPVLDTDSIYYDGDTYASDGTVTRKYGIRAYQSGDESLADAITDGTNTVYKLTTPTTETAEPYDAVQICDPNGTEEYADSRTNRIPVGHVTQYPTDQVAKLDGLPSNFSTLIAPTEKTLTASQNYAQGSYLIYNNTLYKVTTAIASGGTISIGTNVTATTIMAELLALA